VKQVPLCIYHGSCDDGFAAAWAVRLALGDGNVEFYPGVYQQEPPDVTGRDVIFVDFSYKRPVLDAMAAKARSMLILDHHKTAQEDLADVPKAPPWSRWQVWDDPLLDTGVGPYRRGVLFDMERSGAVLAWDYFVGGPLPPFLRYVQDRDLWLKRMPSGDEFTIALRSYPQDFATWDNLVAAGTPALIDEGRSIQRYYRLRVEELKRSAYPALLDGCGIWIANAPYFAASEVAGELCLEHEGAPFGACYFEASAGRWQYSLRSRGDFDVSAVARKFGGGGHKAAAGFTVNKPAHTVVSD
jgi:hypothetical protein